MLILPVLVGILFTIGGICVFFFAEKSSGYVIMSDTHFTPENIRKHACANDRKFSFHSGLAWFWDTTSSGFPATAQSELT